jgi:hypothetical protein
MTGTSLSLTGSAIDYTRGMSQCGWQALQVSARLLGFDAPYSRLVQGVVKNQVDSVSLSNDCATVAPANA